MEEERLEAVGKLEKLETFLGGRKVEIYYLTYFSLLPFGFLMTLNH